MKLITSVLIMALAASASAQMAPSTQTKDKDKKSGTTTTTKTATPTKAAPAPAAKAAQLPAKGAAAKTVPMKTVPAKAAPVKAVKKAPVAVKHETKMAKQPAPRKSAPKVARKPAKPAAVEETATPVKAPVSRSKRDPFETVIVDRGGPGGCTGGGKQCLIPDEVSLKGIVRSSGSIIAVVTNKENRAYFLRENDPVLNGVVTRITDGSITFREKTTDIFGKSVTREVVKKINPTPA